MTVDVPDKGCAEFDFWADPFAKKDWKTRDAQTKSGNKKAPKVGALFNPEFLVFVAQRTAAKRLDYSQIHPLPVNGLQLVHPAIIGVEEVAAIRDRMVVRRADRATGPAPATRSSPAAAMFTGFFAEFDAVFHFILDSGKPGRH
jgi:hypothetical protein